MKKRICTILLALLLCLTLTPTVALPTAEAEDRVVVNSTNFPDATFRSYVEDNFDNGNGSLSASEIAKVTSIDVDDMGISSLQGLGYFWALKELYCRDNQLTTLDVSKNTELKYLGCYKNQLTTLDVSKNTALEYLGCDNNQLTALDVSKNTALERLDCGGNPLTSLTVTDYSALESLNVGDCTALTKLNCCNNALTWLNVDGCTALTKLDCGSNPLTTLAVNNLSTLTTLDVSDCTALTKLNCGFNALTYLDVSGCTALEDLDCRYNALLYLNISTNAALERLECFRNSIYVLDISACPNLIRAYRNYWTTGSSDDVLWYDYYNNYSLAVDATTAISLEPIPAPTITTQPHDITAPVGEAALFKVSASGSGLTYQWQFKKPGGSWTNFGATGHDTATLRIVTYGSMNGYQYRCVITNVAGKKVITNAVTLRAKTTITAQPVTIGAAKGSTAKFTVAATGAGLQYQWQFRKPGGSWTNSGATGAKTATLSVTAYMSMSGYQYRCRITDANGNKTYSNAATLRVADMTISAQPHDITAPVGESALFKVSASGSGLTYQWQFRKPGGSWTNSGATGAKTATLRIVTYGSMNGYQYRCVITDAKGIKVITNVAALRAKTTITAQPKSVTVTSGTTTKFTVTATGAGLQYQWQFKKPGGSWTNSGATGAKTATLSVTAYKSMSGNQYRCVITDANGSKTYSSAVTLTVK